MNYELDFSIEDAKRVFPDLEIGHIAFTKYEAIEIPMIDESKAFSKERRAADTLVNLSDNGYLGVPLSREEYAELRGKANLFKVERIEPRGVLGDVRWGYGRESKMFVVFGGH